MTMRLHYDNLIDYSGVTVTPVSEVATLPATNLIHAHRTKIYRTGATVALEAVVFDLLTAKAVTSICILDHTLRSTDSLIKIQGNASDSWGSPTFSETLTWSDGTIYAVFASQTFRYWRLTFTKSDAANYRDIGRVFLGTYVTLARDPDYNGYEAKPVDRSVSQQALSGASYSWARESGLEVDTTFSKISEAQKTQFTDMADSIGTHTPFFFYMADMHPLPLYCKLSDLAGRKASGGVAGAYVWDMKLSITEQIGAAIVTIPDAPQNLAAYPVDGAEGSIDLEWDASDGDSVTYSVYRRLTTGGASTLITTTSALVYTDTGRTADTEYFYVVKAATEDGTSGYSNEASATTVLSAVTGVATETQADGTIDVTWSAKTGATGYAVYKQLPTVSLLGTTASLTITDPTPLAAQYYVVAATNANGEGTSAAQVLGAVPAAPGAAVLVTHGAGVVRATITAVPNADANYNWYVSTNGGAYAFTSADGAIHLDVYTPGDTIIIKATSLRDLYESAQGAASNSVVVA